MSLACKSLLLTTALAVIAGGWCASAQTAGVDLPPGLSRAGDVVMMQPIADGTGGQRHGRQRAAQPASGAVAVRP